MAWQLVAIWFVVAAATAWFVRDERRRQGDADLARAARYYAHIPRPRHVAPTTASVELPTLRRQGLLHSDRAYFDRYLAARIARPFSTSLKR